MIKGFVFEWRNMVTGSRYIGSYWGQESDDHWGSGVAFLRDVQAHGRQNYQRVTLESVEDFEDLADAERRWLQQVDARNNDQYLNRSNAANPRRADPAPTHTRPLCPSCQQRMCAVAYHRHDRTYYRSLCDTCLRRRKQRIKRPVTPRWKSAGYCKQPQCDRCHFRARVQSQLMVYHVDGNLNNVDLRNLRTVCLNCAHEITKLDLPWRRGDLEEDR